MGYVVQVCSGFHAKLLPSWQPGRMLGGHLRVLLGQLVVCASFAWPTGRLCVEDRTQFLPQLLAAPAVKKRGERCFRCLNQLHVMFEYTFQLGYSTELSASIAH